MSSEKPLVVVTRPVPGPALSLLKGRAEVVVLEEGQAADRACLERALHDADGLLALVTERVDADLFAGAPRLKVVANMAVGYDNIDVGAATQAGVVVTNTPDVLTETSADLAMALLLATARRVVEGDQFIRQGRWESWGPLLLAGLDGPRSHAGDRRHGTHRSRGRPASRARIRNAPDLLGTVGCA